MGDSDPLTVATTGMCKIVLTILLVASRAATQDQVSILKNELATQVAEAMSFEGRELRGQRKRAIDEACDTLAAEPPAPEVQTT